MSCGKNPKLTNSWSTFPGREHSIVLNPGLGCECPFITTVVRCFVSSFTRKLSTLCVHNTFSFNNIQINHRSVFYCLHPTLSQCETPNRKKVLRDVLLQQQPKKIRRLKPKCLWLSVYVLAFNRHPPLYAEWDPPCLLSRNW